ncbi:hypothetical protein [Oceaniglobus roseus]|uniref:hypothetical protein n=1 Tax=Oceaniglobus roseus TaxID=1737570 RepID=UPI000C7F4100|nr:hypothetical protein [Kandeliimicrobium roseum]
MELPPAGPLSDRDFRFAAQQYAQYFARITGMQSEREVWIRHSVIATFAFFGWIAVNRDNVTDTFMLDMVQVQLIYFLPLAFNLGGGLRFFFIQRDINRHTDFLVAMERDILALPPGLAEAAHGRGIRDRHWHAPSICYWVAICLLSGLAGAVLSFHIQF